MKNTTVMQKIKKLVKDNKQIENFDCYVAYDSIDYVIQAIVDVNINIDWINFEYPKYLGQRPLKVKDIINLLKDNNKKGKEISDDSVMYDLKEITTNNNDFFFIFKNRWEVR